MSQNLKKPWILNFLNNPSEKSNRGIVQIFQIAENCSEFYVSDKFHFIKARFESNYIVESFYEKNPQFKPFNKLRGSIVTLKSFKLCTKTLDFIVSELSYMGLKGNSTIGEPKDAKDLHLEMKRKSQQTEIILEDCIIPKEQEEILRKVPGFRSIEIPLHQPSFTNLQIEDSPVISHIFHNDTPLIIEPPEAYTQDVFVEDLVTQKSLMDKSVIETTQETSESEEFILESSRLGYEEEDRINQETLKQVEDLMINYQEVPCNLDPKRYKRIKMNLSVTDQPIFVETTISMYKPLKETNFEDWKKFFK